MLSSLGHSLVRVVTEGKWMGTPHCQNHGWIFTFSATDMEEEGADENIPIELSVRHSLLLKFKVFVTTVNLEQYMPITLAINVCHSYQSSIVNCKYFVWPTFMLNSIQTKMTLNRNNLNFCTNQAIRNILIMKFSTKSHFCLFMIPARRSWATEES